MIDSYNEIKNNNEDIHLIIKQLIKLLYVVIADTDRIQNELILLAEDSKFTQDSFR